MAGNAYLILIDIDSCAYHALHGFSGSLAELKQRLIDTNPALLQDILSFIGDADENDEVVFASGSNRQAEDVDDYNSQRRGSPSAVPAFVFFQDYFAEKLKAKVFLDQFLLADIYGREKKPDCLPGESYQAILRKLYQQAQEEHNHFMLDEYSKINLLYAHVHRFAILQRQRNPQAKLTVIFYDDNIDLLLQGLNNFWQEAQQDFLLKEMKLYLRHYAGQEVTPYADFTGNGEADPHYVWSLRLMARIFARIRSYGDDHAIIASRKKGATAVELQQHHSSWEYRRFDNRYLEMRLGDHKVLMEKLGDFREQEAAALPELEGWDQGYTTADELVRQGLFPNIPGIGRKAAGPAPLMAKDSPLSSAQRERARQQATEASPLLARDEPSCCVLQ